MKLAARDNLRKVNASVVIHHDKPESIKDIKESCKNAIVEKKAPSTSGDQQVDEFCDAFVNLDVADQ